MWHLRVLKYSQDCLCYLFHEEGNAIDTFFWWETLNKFEILFKKRKFYLNWRKKNVQGLKSTKRGCVIRFFYSSINLFIHSYSLSYFVYGDQSRQKVALSTHKFEQINSAILDKPGVACFRIHHLGWLFDSFLTLKVCWHSFPNHMKVKLSVSNYKEHTGSCMQIPLLDGDDKRCKRNLPQMTFHYCIYLVSVKDLGIVSIHWTGLYASVDIVNRAFGVSVQISSLSANELL